MTKLLDVPPAAHFSAGEGAAPADVAIRRLKPHPDDRGIFTELFRNEWGLGPEPAQWNIVRSEANVLRGVHVHRKHLDYITMIAGEMLLILHDLREESGTHRRTVQLRLRADDPHLVVVPVGVAHGFYFAEPATHLYSVTTAFDGSDEFGCHWTAPELEVDWPCSQPILSRRDREAGSYAAMLSDLRS